MSVLRSLVADLGELFSASRGREWFTLLAFLFLQAAFWYFATPGPALLRFAPRAPLEALLTVMWSVLLLLLLPAAIYRRTVGPLRHAGFRLGSGRQGLWAALLLAVPIVPLVALSAADPSLATTYPWPGAWLGGGAVRLLAWVPVYALYYLAFEGFYRGFVLTAFSKWWGKNEAIWLQAVMATLIHVGKPLPELIAAAPASLLFGVMAARSKSVLYPALLHLIIGVTMDVAVLARTGQFAW